MHVQRGRVPARDEDDDAAARGERGVDRRLPVEVGDDLRALTVHLHLGRVVVDAAAARKQVGEVEDAEQRGQAGLEDLGRVEGVRHRIRDGAAERPRAPGQARDVEARRREAAGLSSAEPRGHGPRRQVAGHLGVVRHDLGEGARPVRGVAEPSGEIVRRQPDRRGRGRSGQRLDRGQVHVGGEETRSEEGIAARALVHQVDRLRDEGRVVLARSRVARRKPVREGHLLARDRHLDPGAVGSDGGVDGGVVRLAVRHEDQRLLEVDTVARDVLGVAVEEEVLLVHPHPERPVRHGGRPDVRVVDVRGHERGQPDALERHATAVVGQPLVGVELLGLLDHDVHVLTQVGDRRAAGRRLEAPLGHLDQGGAVTEVLQPALVDQAYVVVTALRGDVRPLREVEPATRVEVVELERDPVGVEDDQSLVQRELTLCRRHERGRRGLDLLRGLGPRCERDLVDAACRPLLAPGQDVVDAERHVTEPRQDPRRRVPHPGRAQPAAEGRQHDHGRLDRRRHEAPVGVHGVPVERGGEDDELVPVGDVHGRDGGQRGQARRAWRRNPLAGPVVGGPDRAQADLVVSAQGYGVARGVAGGEPGVPELRAPCMADEVTVVLPGGLVRRRQVQPERELQGGLGGPGLADRQARAGGGAVRDVGDGRDRQLERRPVEQAGDRVGDPGVCRHREHQPGRSAQPEAHRPSVRR